VNAVDHATIGQAFPLYLQHDGRAPLPIALVHLYTIYPENIYADPSSSHERSRHGRAQENFFFFFSPPLLLFRGRMQRAFLPLQPFPIPIRWSCMLARRKKSPFFFFRFVWWGSRERERDPRPPSAPGDTAALPHFSFLCTVPHAHAHAHPRAHPHPTVTVEDRVNIQL
jgi:hypothetical protein